MVSEIQLSFLSNVSEMVKKQGLKRNENNVTWTWTKDQVPNGGNKIR